MVDVSSITQAGNYPNMLTTASGYQDLANKVQQYNQNQQQFPLLNQLTKAQVASTQQSTINAQTSNTGMQLEQEIKRHTFTGAKFMAASMNPTQDPEDYYEIVRRGVANGNISQTEAQQYNTDIAKAANSSNPAAALRAAAMQHAQSVQTYNDQLKANVGETTFVDGQPVRLPSATTQVQNPNAQVTSGGQRVLGTQGPIQTIVPDAKFLPNGQPNLNVGQPVLKVFPAQPPPAYPGPGAAAPGVAPGAPAAIPGAAQPAPIGGGGYAPAPAAAPSAQPSTPAGAPPAGQPGGGPVTLGTAGLAPADAKQLQTDIDASAAAKTAVPTHNRNIQGLQIAHDALEVVGSGVGSQAALTKLRSYAVALFNSTGFPPPKGLMLQNMAHDKLDKYLTDYARQSATGMTNLDQSLSAASNASPHIDPGAARSVINRNIGLERMERAAADLPATDFSGAKAKMTDKYDPRGFAADMYTTKEIEEIKAHSNAKDWDKFVKSWAAADKAGLLSMQRGNTLKGGVTQDPTQSVTPGAVAPGAATQ